MPLLCGRESSHGRNHIPCTYRSLDTLLAPPNDALLVLFTITCKKDFSIGVLEVLLERGVVESRNRTHFEVVCLVVGFFG
jgi:hypothetical protein